MRCKGQDTMQLLTLCGASGALPGSIRTVSPGLRCQQGHMTVRTHPHFPCYRTSTTDAAAEDACKKLDRRQAQRLYGPYLLHDSALCRVEWQERH